jgi:NAD(P)H-dependent FMN reductase
MTIRIMMLAGSNRKDATSTQLLCYISRMLVDQGCEVELFDLHEMPVPFYDGDVEEYGDANLERLVRLAHEADGFVLATPEYHGSVSGVLKNALDHLSFQQFDGKVVLSVSSAGGAVGVSCLTHLQAIVRYVHGINCTEWISIGGEQRKFSAQGEPEHPKVKERVAGATKYFVGMIQAFRGQSK